MNDYELDLLRQLSTLESPFTSNDAFTLLQQDKTIENFDVALRNLLRQEFVCFASKEAMASTGAVYEAYIITEKGRKAIDPNS